MALRTVISAPRYLAPAARRPGATYISSLSACRRHIAARHCIQSPHTTATTTATTSATTCTSHRLSPRTSARLYSTTEAMASATSFYDFQPVDSTFPAHATSTPNTENISKKTDTYLVFLSTHRKRRTLSSLHPQRQGRPDRQHRLQMRFHPSIQRS